MNKNHKIVIAIGIIMVIGTIILTSKKLDKKQVFRLAEVQGRDYPTSIANQKFTDLVKEKTAGRIQIEIHTDGTLGEETEVIKEMQSGNIAFGRVSIGPLAEYVDQLHALMLPYLYADGEHMWRVLDGEVGQGMLEALGEADLTGLTWYDAGARSFYFTKEIKGIEDFQGQRIRVQKNSLMYAMCEDLGAKPESLSEGDIYIAALNGSLDGAENNIPTYETYKQYEVCPYYILDEHTRMPELLVASNRIMNKLSKEDQNAILEAAHEAGIYERKLWHEREQEAIARLKSQGVQFIRLPEAMKASLKERSESLYDAFGDKYMDTIKQIENLKNID